MNVLIITLGSRGDVQPYIALGKGLRKAGHRVTLCSSNRFRTFVEEHGLDYGYMNDDILKLMDSGQGRNIMENTGNLWQVVKTLLKMYRQVAPGRRRPDCAPAVPR